MDQITLEPWKKLDDEDEEEEEGSAGSGAVRGVNGSLRRVGSLLQLGFGEAGMRIISKSLKQGQ
eukprot:1176289-Rhodomonas_salina.1